jgi:AcrR family transcriptional regulator
MVLTTDASGRRASVSRESGKRRLLDATFASLVELGYANTTIAAVCTRAGVSNGLLFRYFASKEDLLVAAVNDLFPRVVEAVGEEVLACVDADDPLVALVELMWNAVERPELVAAQELYVAARTNAPIREALSSFEPIYRQQFIEFARVLFPASSSHPNFDGFADAALCAIQGAALRRLALGSTALDQANKQALVSTFRVVLDDRDQR